MISLSLTLFFIRVEVGLTFKTLRIDSNTKSYVVETHLFFEKTLPINGTMA